MRYSLLVVSLLFALLACSGLPSGGLSAEQSHVLNNERSTVQFVSIKNSLIAETHRFTSVSGFLSEGDRAQVQINLASVETAIPIRNERMREHLFDVARFATANVSVPLVEHASADLRRGESETRDVSVTLDLHGNTSELNTSVTVFRRRDGGLTVQSVAPVTVNASSFELTEGIEKLRELAGLSVISQAVPVSFVLNFDPA